MVGRNKNDLKRAIRVVLRYGGDVIEERMVRPGQSLEAGGAGGLSVPSPSADRPLVRFDWSDREARAMVPGAPPRSLAPDEPWSMTYGDVEIGAENVGLVRMPQRRFWADGDLALFVMMLALTLSVGQFEVLMSLLGGVFTVQNASSPPPTADLIARLLLEDFEGGKDGSLTRSGEEAKPDSERLYLPTGHKSQLENVGGAKDVGPVHTRPEDAPGLGEVDLEERLEVEKTVGMEEIDWMEAEDGIALPPIDDLEREVVAVQGAPEPMSTREGWGFTDWYAGTIAQAEAGEIRERIHFAKRLLAIDPDSDWALQTLAYYQYLAQDYTATIATYERFIDLYPDDPTGYNNVALVYKRTGEYSVEEGYYRRALAIESGDVHALNNLAVNLAHQHRFQEALSIMDRLEKLDPDDPYADLHRAKIYAEMGRERRAYRYLKRALEGMAALDTLHHIEFRQDIRVDPSFSNMRKERRFQGILERYYGEDGARGLAGDFRG